MSSADVLRSGDLDRRVALYSGTTTQNDMGEETTTWSLFATVWGAREYPRLLGQALFASGQINSQSLANFRIRYRTDVSEATQVVCDGKTYRIVGIGEIGRRAGLELRCEEVIPHA